MLQHAAGGLPGVLVTLPGVHPAPNHTEKERDPTQDVSEPKDTLS